MTPLRIKMKNFRGVGEIELCFEGNGITRISGETGLGKSTTIDALIWCLYGSTKGNLKGDAVVNRFVEKGEGCYVEVEFKDILVIRGRKHKKYKSKLWIFNEVNGEWNSDELTKGVNDDTQETLNDILKMSKEIFTKIISFGQLDSTIGEWGELNDKKLKEAFTESLGLGQIDIDKQLIKDYKQEVEKSLGEILSSPIPLRSRIEVIDFKINSIKQKIENQINEIEEKKERNSANISSLDEEIKRNNDFIIRYKDFAPMSKEEFEERSAAFDENKEKLKKLNELKERTSQTAKESHSLLMLKKRDKYNISLDISNSERQIEEINNIVGTNCNECGKQYEESDIKSRKEIIFEKLKEDKVVLLNNDEELSTVENNDGKQQEILQKVDAAISQINRELEGYNDLVNKYNSDQNFKNTLDTTNDKIVSLKNELQRLNDYVFNNYDPTNDNAEICQLESERTKIQNELLGIDKKIESKDELIRVLDDVFKTLEVSKGYIIDSVTVPLNENIQKCVKSIEPEMDIEVKTLTKLKNGDFREKFSIKCTHETGGKTYKEMSGGQKAICNFCISLGFAITVREMSGDIPDILFIDEGMAALDIKRAGLALNIITELSIPNVFVISHQNDLQEVIPQTIDLIRKNGKTYLKEK